MTPDDVVSVIIPAHNAEATLAATLQSVRAQTHRALEIIVVDDGSTDRTGVIAAAVAAEDPRIRVVTTANGGVARARNVGCAVSRGAFLAPIDADDLWHPDKIARQMAVMRAGGPRMGFVYTPHRGIDESDRILFSSRFWGFAGHVFLRSLLHNFVGNGSALLLRRTAFDAVGGYEPALRDAGAQGCEDLLLQILIARDWTVGVVPGYLTGYRRQGAMSKDVERMERSRRLAHDRLRARHPDTPSDLLALDQAVSWARLAVYLVPGSPFASFRALAAGLRLAPLVALRVAQQSARGKLRRRFGPTWRSWFLRQREAERPCFYDVDPECRPARPDGPLGARIAALEAEEAAFARRSPSEHLGLDAGGYSSSRATP